MCVVGAVMLGLASDMMHHHMGPAVTNCCWTEDFALLLYHHCGLYCTVNRVEKRQKNRDPKAENFDQNNGTIGALHRPQKKPMATLRAPSSLLV